MGSSAANQARQRRRVITKCTSRSRVRSLRRLLVSRVGRLRRIETKTINYKPETFSMIEIKVPTVGESINEVTLIKWLKNDGDYVERDEVIAELESEKATFEVNAEQAGVLKTVGHEGETLNVGDVLARIDESASKPGGNGTLKKEQ